MKKRNTDSYKLQLINNTVSDLEKKLIENEITAYRNTLYSNQIEKLSDLCRFLNMECDTKGYPLMTSRDALEVLLSKHKIPFGKIKFNRISENKVKVGLK